MAIDVLFIHSAGLQKGEQGSAPFVEYLGRDLGSAYNINFPIMPAPSKPDYSRWKREIKKLLYNGSSPQILIGHSLGGSVLLKYLSAQEHKTSALGLFIVASPFWGADDWNVEEFVLRKDFAQQLPKSLKIFLYQSQDDEVVPIDHLRRYQDAIPQAMVRKLAIGGHTFKNGLPELVVDIQKFSAQLAAC